MKNNILKDKIILITGGTGAFGQRFIEILLRDYPDVRKIIVFSRNEQHQLDLQQRYPFDKYPMMRFFIGDIRDFKRLERACEGVDVLIHAASIRNVNIAAYNPDECVKTNVMGTQNVINAALSCGIKKVVSLSSDKACAPTTLYGATKLTSDKLFCAANNISGNKDVCFSVVRFPDILGGQGSPYPFFRSALENAADALPVTDFRMTRFNFSMVEAVKAVLYALNCQLGGEIFVPKCMSYKVTDLCVAMAPNMKQVEIGLRPSEKLHEELIPIADAQDTIDLGEYYAILPAIAFNRTRQQMLEHHGCKFVHSDFHYCSNLNTDWETVDTLRAKIKRYIDNNFAI